MTDPTERTRRLLQAIINEFSGTRAELELRVGQCWDTKELQRDFDVLEFRAPFVIVRRKADQRLGSLLFVHSPRYYFNFEEA